MADGQNKIWTRGHKVTKFEIDGYDMIPQFGILRYYEDIIDAAIHMEVMIVDTTGFKSHIPIVSGIKAKVEIKHPSSDEPWAIDDLYITNISQNSIDNKRELYTLTLETKSSISNHTTRCWTRYEGKISESVKKILKETMEVPEDRMDVEETQNESRFTGNFRRPFKVITKLCPKAIPASADATSQEKGTGGYFFFENYDGYHFKSVDTLLEKGISEEDGVEYVMRAVKESLDPETNYTLAANPQWEESHDILKKLRAGQYRTANWYFNIIDRNPYFSEYNYQDSTQMEKANEDEVIPQADFASQYSRIILGTLDMATFSPPPEGEELDTPQDQARYQAHSNARYASLFSQVLNITVPMNISLRVGDSLNVKFPTLNNGNKETENNPDSGKYLIVRLSHVFGNPKGDFTGLALVRDTSKAT